MKINIKTTNLLITPALSDYIHRKFEFLARFSKNLEAKSELLLYLEIARNTKHHRKGNVFTAEAKISLPQQTLYVNHSDIDIRAALDVLKEKLKRELVKYKEKISEEKRRKK